MKTKRFLLATSGATVDGRTIDAKYLEEMAASYDPNTYAARLNIEHIRGFSGDRPFRSYGDVLSLETGEVTVNFNGKDEKRTALYGVFEVTEDAKKLNDASQKMYPSIEINPDFGGKGFAYLMGVALTDSPASIGTERLQFNRHLPGMMLLSRDEAALLEFAEADQATTADGLMNRLGAMFDKFADRFSPANPEPKPEKQGSAEAQTFTASDLKDLFGDMAQAFTGEISSLRDEMREQSDRFGIRLKAMEAQIEAKPSEQYTQRPSATGANGNNFKTDC